MWNAISHVQDLNSCRRLFNSPLVTVLNAPITIGIIVTFMFNSFFNSLKTFFHFYFLVSKVYYFASSHFFLVTIRSGSLAEIRWSVCMSTSYRNLCVSFSRTAWVVHIPFVRWSNLKITLATLSCLVLYSFCDNLLHSLIRWLMVSSLSPHNLHLLFCCVLSILALI